MKLSEHADHTEKLFGLRAEEIHKWIDGYFDRDEFFQLFKSKDQEKNNPYNHRKYRHCREAVDDVLLEFSGKYTAEQIRQVFECHLQDDYDGYLPSREDFINGRFTEKYHESDDIREPILSPIELRSYFKGRRYKHSQKKEQKSFFSGFSSRFILPAVAAFILFIIAIFWIILPLFHESLLTEKEEMIQEISSLAVSIVDYYQTMEISHQLTREEAQLAVIDEIMKLRYGPDNENYFWITDMQPVMIMHPWRIELIGEDLSQYTDSMNRSGKRLFVESVNLINRDGGGFQQYLWQLDEDSNETVPKLSYVQGIKDWDWIIGTGVFIHDIEEEISRLTSHLIVVMLVISLVLILFLVYLIFQSKIIERRRRNAEAGLVEVKDRYRALVESSNEGYFLVMDKKVVYSNHTFTRMTGYNEENFRKSSPWDLLFPPKERTPQIIQYIENLISENPKRDEFEARITCFSGNQIDVIMRISRIYLSERNGIVISFNQPQAIQNTRIDNGSSLFLLQPTQLIQELLSSRTGDQVVKLLNLLPQTIRAQVMSGIDAETVRRTISRIYNTAVQRLVEHAVADSNEPTEPFAFLSLGSSGRQEMTLFSDQDNAIVFKSDIAGSQLEKQRLLYLNISDKVCRWLNLAGFSFCPGGIMAINPANCLSLTEWKERYTKWIIRADSISLLDIHVFFDLSCGWGDDELVQNLKEYIFSEIASKPEFLSHFAHNCLQYPIPRGLFGKVKIEERDGSNVINIKECLIPVINFARLYSLREEILLTSTKDRLLLLRDGGILDESSCNAIILTFENLWELRFINQLLAHESLRKVNDDLAISRLSDSSKRKLKDNLKVLRNIQSRLSYDFLGIDLS